MSWAIGAGAAVVVLITAAVCAWAVLSELPARDWAAADREWRRGGDIASALSAELRERAREKLDAAALSGPEKPAEPSPVESPAGSPERQRGAGRHTARHRNGAAPAGVTGGGRFAAFRAVAGPCTSGRTGDGTPGASSAAGR